MKETTARLIALKQELLSTLTPEQHIALKNFHFNNKELLKNYENKEQFTNLMLQHHIFAIQAIKEQN